MYAFLGMTLFWIRLKLEFEFGETFISSSFRSLVVRPILSEGTTRLIIPSLQASSAVIACPARIISTPLRPFLTNGPSRPEIQHKAPTRPPRKAETAAYDADIKFQHKA